MNRELFEQLLANRLASFDESRILPFLTEESVRKAAAAGTATTRAGVAVIPVRGILTLHGIETFFGTFGGRTTVLRRRLTEALTDDSVGAIVLDFDSPGGTVDGIPELAADIRSARGKKPMIAVANTLLASAAYWLASQCDEIVACPSSEVGSIGVIAQHMSFAQALENEGIELNVFRSAPFKAEGNPLEKLTPEAGENIQAMVQKIHKMFVADVAKGRGVKGADVDANFGQGRVMLAKDAVAAGLADRVQTIEQVVGGLVKGRSSRARRRRSSLAFR